MSSHAMGKGIKMCFSEKRKHARTPTPFSMDECGLAGLNHPANPALSHRLFGKLPWPTRRLPWAYSKRPWIRRFPWPIQKFRWAHSKAFLGSVRQLSYSSMAPLAHSKSSLAPPNASLGNSTGFVGTVESFHGPFEHCPRLLRRAA